ncbi:MAG: GGDEF domain-containing protein, partial [Betaproteobacteria bacterium]|nr:GGDEF domain-containing protein [Betaproteobacteria bacterium]
MSMMMSNLIKKLSDFMSVEFDLRDIALLFSPHFHINLFRIRRAQIIILRTRLLALLFALFTPLWSIVDFVFLPESLWSDLALIRLFTTVAFVAMVMSWRPSYNLWNAYRALATLFVIPAMFYLVTQESLAHYHLDGISNAVKSGYAYLPFVLLAGISIFP